VAELIFDFRFSIFDLSVCRRLRCPFGRVARCAVATVGRSVGSLLLSASIFFATDGLAWAECPDLTSVSIVSSVDGGAADKSRKLVRSGQKVVLHAVVTGKLGDAKFTWIEGEASAKGEIENRKSKIENCALSLRWYKLEPESESYDNSHSAPPAEISYRETSWKEGWSAVADVHPTLMHDEFGEIEHGLGTMRFKLEVRTGAKVLATPGIECRESGAACRNIHTVAYRKDDTYLGYLYELFNTPYIYGSKGIKGGHQSDLLVGSDCADFTVYGKRRQKGKDKFPYTYTGGLYKYASKRWPVTLDPNGVYLDRKGKPLTFGPDSEIRPGDLFNFENGHVGVLAADDGDGKLDTGDFIMHTLFREPETVPISKCRWPGIDGKEILRLK